MNDTMTMADVVAKQGSIPEAPSAPTETPAKSAAPAQEKFGTSLSSAFSAAMGVEKAAPVEKSDADKESRSAKDFKAIKAERDGFKAEIDKLRGEYEAAKASPVNTAEIDTMRTERDKLSEQLRLTAVERHPKFIAYYDDRQKGFIEQAKKIAGDDGENAARLLAMADSDARMNGLEEIFSALPATKQAQLGSLLTKYDELRDERATAIANANQSYEAIQAQERSGREAQNSQSAQVFGNATAEAEALEVFQRREGDSEWNSEMETRLNSAKSIFMGELPVADLARASIWAAAAPKYRELLIAQIEVNRRLQKQITDFQGATPSAGKTNGQAGEPAARPKSFVERYQEARG